MRRRTFLLSGLSIPTLLCAQYGKEVKAKNVIYIFLEGGISAQETFNPRHLAPPEFKGPFSAIKTKTDNLFFSDKLPLLAGQTDKFSIIQSMSHGQAAHEQGVSYLYTGYKPSPALEYASLGSIISSEMGGRNNLPPYITIPNSNPFSNSGFLSSKFNPFSLGSDPVKPDFKVRDLDLAVDSSRFDRRKSLLETVNNYREDSDNLKAIDSFYDQAFDLMNSQKAKDAFKIDLEPQKYKDSYGVSEIGARLLMARRLVEAGVRIVKVTYGNFDNHDNINAMERTLPPFDKALSVLFQDLSERGMLDETLVVVTSEFGRTIKINKTAGRDHEPRVFSTLIGGGGIKNGQVYGKASELSSEVEENPVTPDDLFSTIFHLVGINSNKELMTQDLRPIPISKGKILQDLV